MHPPAFILLGGFGVVCRNAQYMSELRDRGLKILLMTPARWRGDVRYAMDEPGHPATAIDDVGFVNGSLGSPESFTPDAIAQAMRWTSDYAIEGVFAVGEVLVEQAGLIADALGLRSPGLRATRVCRNKALQRWYLREWSPWCRIISPHDRDTGDARFPAVLKPVSRHSSSGVVACESADALAAALRHYPDHEPLLLEELVAGREFSVEVLVQDRRPIFTSVTGKETTETHSAHFVELVHSVPGGDTRTSAILSAASHRALPRLGFEDGIAHFEWRLGDRSGPVLMEVAARTPGDGLLSLYELACGRPMEPEIVRICLGEPASYPPPGRYARQVYLDHDEGRLDDVTCDVDGVKVAWIGDSGVWPDLNAAPGDPPTLRAVLALQKRGTLLRSLGDSDDRAVTFLIDAPAPDELDDLEGRVRAGVRLHTTPVTGR